MGGHIYIRDEFLERIGVDSGTLETWEQLKLVIPSGYTDDNIPCYSEDSIERVLHIQKLQELGYEPEEINKIVRKVGLPGRADGKDEDKKAGQYLTVGNLAEQVGVSPRTIKHWEDKGIIEANMRSAGGFRLYSEVYVYLCKLLLDLQLFGYSLDEIKTVSDYFREFLDIQKQHPVMNPDVTMARLDAFLEQIAQLSEKISKFKDGIQRWDELLKKRKKEIAGIRNQIEKREREKEKEKEKAREKAKAKKRGEK
ncbi:MerR family transcriptional regulator [bacterium]|nr:MerR family transcriptional regulator [bacterium]